MDVYPGEVYPVVCTQPHYPALVYYPARTLPYYYPALYTRGSCTASMPRVYTGPGCPTGSLGPCPLQNQVFLTELYSR